ncbi:MAG: transposase, partial [Solirubrobacteraceae bacterium]
MKGQRYNNRKTPAQLLCRLRAAPAGRASEIEIRRRRSIVLRLVETLQVLVEQIAGLESEIAETLDAHPDAIAADGGQAPVAKESGKRKHANFRWACNKRLRNALFTLAHS